MATPGGEKKNLNQTGVESTERLKIMRCEWGLSKKDNLQIGNSRKTLFDEDLITSCENISAENFITSSANDSLSVGSTAKMLTK